MVLGGDSTWIDRGRAEDPETEISNQMEPAGCWKGASEAGLRLKQPVCMFVPCCPCTGCPCTECSPAKWHLPHLLHISAPPLLVCNPLPSAELGWYSFIYPSPGPSVG
jgi:hypothetical protein